jgi:hypothetical protein
MNSRGRRFILAVALALPSMQAGAAPFGLVDRAQLQALLMTGEPCCMIDARPEQARKHRPIADALAYEEGMTLSPAGPVVVIGDSDKRTLSVGKALANRFGAGKVYAVKGGYAAWQAVERERLKSALPLSFIIPSDTCQQGPPLQQLPFDRR